MHIDSFVKFLRLNGAIDYCTDNSFALKTVTWAGFYSGMAWRVDITHHMYDTHKHVAITNVVRGHETIAEGYGSTDEHEHEHQGDGDDNDLLS